MSIVIREAMPADVPDILRLVQALADYEHEPHAVKADAVMMHAALFGPEANAHGLIAEHDGRAVGFAVWFHNFSTWTGKRGIYLEDLFVEPEARGLGIGKALLVQLARIAVERDCGRFEWAVLDWNAPSIAFYKALGAKPMDEWTVMRVDGDALTALAAQ
ncbi:GNAT family N-acetyltransferase [Flavisphingomonas formosensis]|uniref:GNAT family N-acetyltransferase n=1 Tax=Flavisphingomonas formosensis TaxID=861534 RepID=UPI0012F9035C|nr:GNAT family N-acetyltransferase [Sphingomonas formosensis]